MTSPHSNHDERSSLLPAIRPLRFTPFDPAPDRLERTLAAVAVAVVWTSFYWGASSSPDYVSDIDQVWHGTRALLRGLDPYSVIGPGREYHIGFPLYYPLPALVAFTPFALLPLQLARLVLVAISTGLLAYAVTAGGWHRLPIFVSGAFVAAAASVQWSPLLTAAFVLPWLGPALLLKPNIGLAIAATSPGRGLLLSCALGGGALLLVSLGLHPTWPGRWLTLVRNAPHFTPPVLLPGGVLVLLALLRWRRPEARLLVAMACVPHTTLTYETLPLLLIPRNWKESLLLAALSFVVLVLQAHLDIRVEPGDPLYLEVFVEWVTSVGTFAVALLYLPATILVLRRPNEGDPPAWLAALRERLPVKKVAALEDGSGHPVVG
jgi:hypothetical protein